MKEQAGRVPTGSPGLDEALGGGIPHGSVLLVEGEEGAGATEFAVTVLRAVLGVSKSSKARFLSALRSAPRIAHELSTLFADAKEIDKIQLQIIRTQQVESDCVLSLLDLKKGDVLVIESASALARATGSQDLLALFQVLGDHAAETGVVLILLHTPGTVEQGVEASLAESADGVFLFRWRESGNVRRRALTIKKMRGLPPALDGEQIPVLEVSLKRGTGFAVSKSRSVI